MKSSRIVKSAYRRAVKAGFSGSLKDFANSEYSLPIEDAADAWLANKAKQRKPSRNRKAVHGHTSVHDIAVVRSERTASGSSIGLRGEVRAHGGGR